MAGGDDDGGGCSGARETDGMAHNCVVPHTSQTLKERQQLHHDRIKEGRERDTEKSTHKCMEYRRFYSSTFSSSFTHFVYDDEIE